MGLYTVKYKTAKNGVNMTMNFGRLFSRSARSREVLRMNWGSYAIQYMLGSGRNMLHFERV